MIKRTTLFFAIVLGMLGVSSANTPRVTINRIGTWGNGNAFFSATVTKTDPAWTGLIQWYVSVNTDAGKAMWAVILSAYSLGKTVTVTAADDACPTTEPNCTMRTVPMTQVWTD